MGVVVGKDDDDYDHNSAGFIVPPISTYLLGNLPTSANQTALLYIERPH